MHMVSVREIELGSAEYEQEVRLRNKILREPLGRRLTEAELAQDAGDHHLGAFSEGRLVGCLVLKPLPDAIIKMRQVAIASDQQGKGVGKRLVEAAEWMAAGLGFHKMILHARETACAFYQNLGYVIEGEIFEEAGLPHFKMTKAITPKDRRRE